MVFYSSFLMKQQSFHDRMLELTSSLDLIPQRLAEIAHVSSSYFSKYSKESNPRLHSIRRIAEGFDLIPVMIYTLDGELIDLGEPSFEFGTKIHNYVGQVISFRRKDLGFSKRDLQIKVGAKSSGQIFLWESGSRVLKTNKLEEICSTLDLVPSYLVPKKIRFGLSEYDAQFSKTLKHLGDLTNSSYIGDKGELLHVFEYVNKIKKSAEFLSSDLLEQIKNYD